MPDILSVNEAWAVLGKDARRLMAGVAGLPRSERAPALRALADDARRLARPLLAASHPDKGGSPESFRRVQLALESIVRHTDEFERKAADAVRRAEELAERRPVFIKVDK